MLVGPTNSYVPLHSNCQRLVGDKSDDDDANNYDGKDGKYDQGWKCNFSFVIPDIANVIIINTTALDNYFSHQYEDYRGVKKCRYSVKITI